MRAHKAQFHTVAKTLGSARVPNQLEEVNLCKYKEIVRDGDQNVLTRRDILTPPLRGRTTPRDKERIVIGIKSGLVSIPEVVAALDYSVDEIREMIGRFDQFGRKGLSVKRVQSLSKTPRRASKRTSNNRW